MAALRPCWQRVKDGQREMIFRKCKETNDLFRVHRRSQRLPCPGRAQDLGPFIPANRRRPRVHPIRVPGPGSNTIMAFPFSLLTASQEPRTPFPTFPQDHRGSATLVRNDKERIPTTPVHGLPWSSFALYAKLTWPLLHRMAFAFFTNPSLLALFSQLRPGCDSSS